MAFAMRFNFRASSGYVTDDAEGVPVTGQAFPTTYTNTNGYSINAGWTAAPEGTADRNSALDARLAGINYQGPGANRQFKIDLASGSAPGAGTYTLDAAFGDTSGNRPSAEILDNTTPVSGVGILDGTNAANEWYDVTGVLRTSAAAWVSNHVTADKAFSSTTCIVSLNPAGHAPAYSVLAHFRMALSAAPATPIPRITMPPMRAA